MYAVVDTETTGLSPNLRHRIAEIAVVLVDDKGNVEDEWCTLVNPDRDLGPQHIHGIRGVDARRAPRFEDVAGHLVHLLKGRVLAAHNLRFDRMFLDAEFDRLGVPFPLANNMGLCTMTLSSSLLSGSGRSLRDCCLAANVPLTGWHSALADARATAGLLGRYIELTDPDWPWAADVPTFTDVMWPHVPLTAFEICARSDQASPLPAAGFEADAGLMDRLVDFMPRVDSSDLADPYLAVLDEALSDRYLSADESASLRALAESLEIPKDTLFSLHREYLNALARVALADDHLSEEEKADLYRVADILDLPEGAVAAALEAARQSATPLTPAQLDLEPGSLIVFTGAMAEEREVWMQRAAEHGWVSHPAVTKKVSLVVAADVDSLSGKAKKARGYGIPIMSIEDFRAALGYPQPDPGAGLHENWSDGERLWARALREERSDY